MFMYVYKIIIRSGVSVLVDSNFDNSIQLAGRSLILNPCDAVNLSNCQIFTIFLAD